VRMVLLLEVPGVDRDDGDERQRDVEGDLAPEIGRAGRVRLASAAGRDERRAVVLSALMSVSTRYTDVLASLEAEARRSQV